MSDERSGAAILIECLVRQGVEFVFGYPGGAVLPIYDELFGDHRIRHILVRHEISPLFTVKVMLSIAFCSSYSLVRLVTSIDIIRAQISEFENIRRVTKKVYDEVGDRYEQPFVYF